MSYAKQLEAAANAAQIEAQEIQFTHRPTMTATSIKDTTSHAEVLAMAYSARETLRQRARATLREYSDRIKQCDDIMRAASLAQSGAAAGALPGTAALSLSPDKAKLLLNPTHGL